MMRFFKYFYIYMLAVGGVLMLPYGHALAGEHEPLYVQRPHVEEDVTPLKKETVLIKTEDGAEYYFDVEMALSPQEQAKGLMFREDLPSDSGMLFIFPGEAMRAFWMKNTLIPLDMIFIRHDGLIHHIHQNAQPQDLTPITSRYPSTAILELNGGTASRLGIKEGDVIMHEAFHNIGAEAPAP